MKGPALTDLPVGKIVSLDIEAKRILFANLGDGVYAVSAICTHEEADLGEGRLRDHCIVCPLHESEFDLHTGGVQNPPAERDLQTYPTRVSDGYVFVEV